MMLNVHRDGEAMTVVVCVSGDAPEPGSVLMAKAGSILTPSREDK